jgi:hypothetical protein
MLAGKRAASSKVRQAETNGSPALPPAAEKGAEAAAMIRYDQTGGYQ